MAKKVSRDSKTGQFIVMKQGSGVSVVEKTTGKQLPLKGYGAFKGRYVVKEGVDITKPIYEQGNYKSGSYGSRTIVRHKPTKKK